MDRPLDEIREFFEPYNGLELDYYLDPLGPTASEKQRRLRKQSIHHLARYQWAAMVLDATPPGAILDAGCGAGYGAFVLARSLPGHTIVGGDTDSRAIEFARQKYGTLPNLEFVHFDIESWRIGEDKRAPSFAHILAFDTLEQVAHRDIALVNMAESLNRDGMLLLSTPCKSENLLHPSWEHHRIEYSAAYLQNLLRRFFGTVLVPQHVDFPHASFWTDVVNRGETRYLLRANPLVCRDPLAFGLS